jgi:uncharacterized SAM-binding protein YcdF (DUF218 family)
VVRPRQSDWVRRGVIAGVVVVLGLCAWAVIARKIAPVSNTSLTRFDAIIVLGYPADGDGNPTPTQLARVTEAVHEYERGVAPRLIVTGAAVANHFVEAEVMARSAHAQGVPEPAIVVEPRARDTIQNACYAERIMKAHGWGSAEVVSSASHLPRAALIFSKLPLEWRMHAAPSLSAEADAHGSMTSFVETLKTLRYLTWARWTEGCQP